MDVSPTVTARLLIVDDHPIFRQGVVDLFRSRTDLTIAAMADGVQEAIAALSSGGIDVVLLDLSLPDGSGFDVIRARPGGLGPARYVVLTAHGDAAYQRYAQELGASACLSKAAEPSAIVAAVLKAAGQPREGGSAVATETANERPLSVGALDQLSPKQRAVLWYLGQNCTSPQVAQAMGISVKTVHNHRANICERLGLRGSNKLLEFAIKMAPLLGDAPRLDD